MGRTYYTQKGKNIEDITRLYLQETRDYGSITPQKEKKLAELIKIGDQKAKERLITANLRLVPHIAKNFKGRGVLFLDLVQQGNLALIRSAEKYNPKKYKTKFSTFAGINIHREIERAVRAHKRTIRIPDYLHDIVKTVSYVLDYYRQNYNRRPTEEEIAERANISLEKVQCVLKDTQKIRSLDEEIFEDSQLTNIIENRSIEPVIDTVLYRILRQKVKDVLSKILDEKKYKVIIYRFGLDGARYTLKEIEKMLGISREWVRQLEIKALEILKNSDITKQLLFDFYV